MDEWETIYVAGVGYVRVQRSVFNEMYDMSWRLFFSKECTDPIPLEPPKAPEYDLIYFDWENSGCARATKLQWFNLN